MRSNRRLARAALAAPVILAFSAAARGADGPSARTYSGYASIPPKSSPQAVPPGGLPYVSSGPASLSMIPPAPAMPAASTLPPIGQVATPYPSSGPALALPSGSPQGAGPSGPGGGLLDVPGGSMAAPSPYESTATPGTSSPFGPAAGSGYQAAANAGPEAGPVGAGGGVGGGGAAASGLGGFGGTAEAAFAMIGDASPLVGLAASPPAAPGNPPKFPPPGARSQIAPSVRGFKIAENQSPVPQDRLFFGFNSYNNVNKTLDKFFQAPIKGIQIYRYVFGYEKTFNDGRGSIGIRLPLDNVFARSNVASLTQGGNSTALGNLTIYAKHVFAYNAQTGSVATGGFAISPSTAAPRFANAAFLAPSNTTSFQPFFAFLLNHDRLYFQGFTALDVPVDPAQPTLIYNDFGVGYYVYRDPTFRNLITGIAPTLEVHVNTPINHSGAYNPKDNNGTPDIVNITSGLNTRFRQNSILTMGVVVPVTGPRPFSVEGTVLLNFYFGRSRRTQAAPIIGG